MMPGKLSMSDMDDSILGSTPKRMWSYCPTFSSTLNQQNPEQQTIGAYGDARNPRKSPAKPRIDPMHRTDNFMMYGFKVAMCTRQGRHPWSECPYAHPTENARRRDPRLFSYSCVECPAYRNNGFCTKGDQCEYSHGVFEARLHPDSYRTVACKEGKCCQRKICFFYHSKEEAREPTGLQDARVKIAAEMGAAAIDVNIDTVRSVANSILASNPSLSNTMLSLNNLSTPICSHQSTLQSILSNSQTSSVPLQSSGSLNAGTISRMLSGNLPTANSGVLIATETVAPCMKGANKNRLTVKELAAEVGLHADALMSSLRIAALQGELSPHSSAPSVGRGQLSDAVEHILMRISVLEDCPIEKLRGWLLRVPGVDACPKVPDTLIAPGRATAGQLGFAHHVNTEAFREVSRPEGMQIRAHFAGRSASRGWDAKPFMSDVNEGYFSKGPGGISRATSAIDAAQW